MDEIIDNEWMNDHQLEEEKEVEVKQVSEGDTKVIQKQDDKYHLACQNCGTTSKPLQMIPFRNDNHVVGLLTSCNDCKDILYGQRFDRKVKFNQPYEPITEKG